MADTNGKDLPVPLTNRVAEVVVGAASKINTPEALSALTQMVSAVREFHQVHQTESTRREKLRTYRDTEVERIKASERVLRDYFDRVFEERRETHERLFQSLDAALASGDVGAIQTVVGGIVEVARTSPLADVGNLAALRQAMGDPDAVFDI